MRRFRWSVVLSVGALVAAGAPRAEAQTAYYSQDAFLAAFKATGQNSLDDLLVPDGSPPLSVVTGLQFGITVGTLGDPDVDPTGDPFFPPRALGPANQGSQPNSWLVSDGGRTQLTFTTPVSGFGANFFDFASTDDVIFRFFLGDAELGTQVFDLVEAGPGYDGFYGVALESRFDRLEIESSVGEYFEMDDLAVGDSTVPEPAPMALTVAGLTVIGALRRRAVGTSLTRGGVDA